jgi:hypothetical protein
MEPLEPELRRIIREGLAEAAPGPEVEARVLAGLLRRLPGEGGPDGDPGGAVGTGTAGMTGGIKALIVAAVVAVGGVGVGVATRGPEAVRVQAVERVDEVEVPVVVPEVQVVEPLAVTREDAPRVSGSRVARSGSGPRVAGSGEVGPDALLAETRGLAEAEGALGRGEFAAAVELARALGRRFPAGQLGLEREAVEVCGRCGLDEPGAGAAAAAFLRAHGDAAVAGKVRARCAEALQKNLAAK